MLEPNSIEELIAEIKEHPRVLAVGGRTKPGLSGVDGVELLSTRNLSGITQYEPSEYTFTALAGTTVREVSETLAKRGQYLPFDPCLAAAGATLGGTVASGISGAGRFRYGGVRDFLIGIRFVDGAGRALCGGGKVVKNAAGFDTPKMMVGSLGRFGVLTELTFKVFPKPETLQTLKIACASHAEATDRLAKLASGRWELDALDYRAAEKTLYARLGGPQSSVERLAQSFVDAVDTKVEPMADDQAVRFWSDLSEMKWAQSDSIMIKVPLTPKSFLALQTRLESVEACSIHLSAGGAVGWIAIAAPETLVVVDEVLSDSKLGGLAITGATPSLWIGHRSINAIEGAVKQVFDPDSRFPAF